MFIIVDNDEVLEGDTVNVLAVYRSGGTANTAQEAAEDWARQMDAETVTVWTVPHIRTFRFRSEVRLRLIEDD